MNKVWSFITSINRLMDTKKDAWIHGTIVIPIDENSESGEMRVRNVFMESRDIRDNNMLNPKILKEFMNSSLEIQELINSSHADDKV